MRSRLVLALIVFLALLLAGCGGGHKPVPRPAVQPCPLNHSYMGCSQLTPKGLRGVHAPAGLAPPAGALFPDVSVWQGAVNWGSVAAWQRAHHWNLAGIWKLGEYTLDVQADRNSHETATRGFWRSGYWFVRATGCAHEGGLIVWAAKRYGLKVVVLDEEVPEARGYDQCLTAAVKRAGLIPVTYAGPGTWPGGPFASNPAWTATYGPRVGCLPWSCHPIAWQFTDGKWGAVYYVPGIGRDDVSVDYGITKLGVPKPPPPDPHGYHLLWSKERYWVVRYDGARKHPKRYAGYLKHTLEPELGRLANDIYVAAHRHKPPNWGHVVKGHGDGSRGVRFHMIETRALGQLVVR